MEAFTQGDYAYETACGATCVHVPASICATELAHAAAKLVAAKVEATEPRPA